jgi:hypothetical protein
MRSPAARRKTHYIHLRRFFPHARGNSFFPEDRAANRELTPLPLRFTLLAEASFIAAHHTGEVTD